MTEDINTKDLTPDEKLDLILERLIKLETFVYATKPLPPNYDERFAALEADVKEVKRDMRQLRDHDWQRERELSDVRERLDLMEQRPS